jgi:hypothetical protein
VPTTIRVWTGREPKSLSVSLERTPVILADVRKALPQLKRELSRKWPIDSVYIEDKLPRRSNPFDASQIVEAATLALVVGFAHQVGKELGTGEGLAIKKYMREWLQGFNVLVKAKLRVIPRSSRSKKKLRTDRRTD